VGGSGQWRQAEQPCKQDRKRAFTHWAVVMTMTLNCRTLSHNCASRCCPWTKICARSRQRARLVGETQKLDQRISTWTDGSQVQGLWWALRNNNLVRSNNVLDLPTAGSSTLGIRRR
jgi:hypothetical protein